MMLFMWIFLTVYVIFVGVIVLVGLSLHNRKITISDSLGTVEISDLVVLIPFRDEENRIKVLLDSIESLSSFPKEFIFVNDHSTDNGVRLIEGAMVDIPYRIINLPDGLKGKKHGLRFATNQSESKYILTWDADVFFEPDYFVELAKQTEADMLLLPAVLKAEKAMEYLYEIDVVLANAINTGLAGLKRPIMASGANFLYKRDAFNEVDDLSSHGHMASGDDTYLLRDFRRNNKAVRVVSGLTCAVYTETPKSFKEFIDQRLRWVGKTMDIKDNLGTFVALFQFVLTLTFFGLLISMAFFQGWESFLLLFIGKIIADLVLFLPFFFRMRRLTTWAIIPLYEILFPFYSLLLFILMFTYRPKWKGREISSKN